MELLHYAVAKEDEAAAFYDLLASQAQREGARELFRDFARQELAHRKVFQRIIQDAAGGAAPSGAAATRGDLQIGDYLVDVPFSPAMSYQDILILAMKREEKSQLLYRDLAAATGDPALAETLRRLAGEESRHKEMLERLYDAEILTQD